MQAGLHLCCLQIPKVRFSIVEAQIVGNSYICIVVVEQEVSYKNIIVKVQISVVSVNM